jgi:hypothetical protein
LTFLQVENTLFCFPSLAGLARFSEILATLIEEPSIPNGIGQLSEGTVECPVHLHGDKLDSWISFGLWYLHFK